MRVWLCRFLILAVLTVSFEGVVGVGETQPPHEAHAHGLLDTSHSPAHDESGSDSDHDHCGHFCHGHLTNVALTASVMIPDLSAAPCAWIAARISSRTQAPPTPPPNV